MKLKKDKPKRTNEHAAGQRERHQARKAARSFAWKLKGVML